MKVAKWAGSHLVWALLLGTALLLVAGSGSLAYSERAVVKLFVAPRQVQVHDVALTNLQTTKLTASVTETQQVAATLETLPAAVATGRVTFMCSPMTSCPNGYTVAAGTVVESTSGAEYRTLSTVSFPSCAPSSPVGITALIAGSASNAGIGGVAYARVPSYIHVSNSWPVTGGRDARSVPVVQQASVNAAIKTLIDKAGAELPAQLQAKAGGLTYLTTGAASFTTGGSYRVGDHAPAFTVQVTGTLTAIAFPPAGARALLRQALSRQSSSGYELTNDEVTTTYSVGTDGTLNASATGYMIPAVDVRALANNLRGQSVESARTLLRGQSLDGGAEIQTSPVAMPWLPLSADHISVLIVEAGTLSHP